VNKPETDLPGAGNGGLTRLAAIWPHATPQASPITMRVPNVPRRSDAMILIAEVPISSYGSEGRALRGTAAIVTPTADTNDAERRRISADARAARTEVEARLSQLGIPV
jgi:hypothetical protein